MLCFSSKERITDSSDFYVNPVHAMDMVTQNGRPGSAEQRAGVSDNSNDSFYRYVSTCCWLDKVVVSYIAVSYVAAS